jgi:hypothetical protein
MSVLAAVPQAHALTSTTFRLPPLDGSLTIPEVYDWHLIHNPDHVLWIHSSGGAIDDRTEITLKQGVHAIHRAARLLTEHLSQKGLQPATRDAPVIALFAATGK